MRRKAQPTLWSSRRRAIDMGGRFLVVTTNTRPRSRYPVWRRVDRPHGGQPAPFAVARSAATFLWTERRPPIAGTCPEEAFAAPAGAIPRQFSHRRETTSH